MLDAMTAKCRATATSSAGVNICIIKSNERPIKIMIGLWFQQQIEVLWSVHHP